MKINIAFVSSFLFICSFATAQNADYPFRAVPFTQVHLNDEFWLPRLKTNHTVTIPASFECCENTGLRW